MKNNNKIKLACALTSLIMGGFTVSSEAAAAPLGSIRALPKDGLNVNWPVLSDKQYFTYKGKNARSVTLRSIMNFDCRKIMDLYDENPQLALDDLEMLILVQFSLRGIDIQTMDPRKRENLALAEIEKRLRQLGRFEELKLLDKDRIIPSVSALCHILGEEKHNILRQLYHVKHQWDIDSLLTNN